MRICVLGSGSSGNCIFVSSGATGLLIDAGFSGKETLRRFESVGIDPSAIHAILLTHEHGDHIGGLKALFRKLKADVYANAATIQGVERSIGENVIPWKVFSAGFSFQIGDIAVEPFTVCHDALDPVGFAISSGDTRIGVVTDIGMVTTVVREKLRNCQALIIEANHDERMLRDAARPWALKQRIAGRQGHLSNRNAAELVAECAGPGLTRVFLAHLSSECNEPGLAVRTVQEALEKKAHGHVRVVSTYQDRPAEAWPAED